ncbi:hypothetical protein [Clostridium aciditolerans]|nr:hypothetical protein [Clostridium aciditolerans]
MKQVTQIELQHDFKRENNKPRSRSQSSFESKAIREAKQIVKSAN